MSLWRQLTHGLRVLIHSHAADRDAADEVDHYLQQATDAFVANGLSPRMHGRAARLELGNPTLYPRRDPRLRLGAYASYTAYRPALCRASTDPQSWLCPCHYAYLSARHRRQHGDLQRGESHPV